MFGVQAAWHRECARKRRWNLSRGADLPRPADPEGFCRQASSGSEARSRQAVKAGNHGLFREAAVPMSIELRLGGLSGRRGRPPRGHARSDPFSETALSSAFRGVVEMEDVPTT